MNRTRYVAIGLAKNITSPDFKIETWCGKNDNGWSTFSDQPYLHTTISFTGQTFDFLANEIIYELVKNCLLAGNSLSNDNTDISNYKLAIVITLDFGKPERATVEIEPLIKKILAEVNNGKQ